MVRKISVWVGMLVLTALAGLPTSVSANDDPPQCLRGWGVEYYEVPYPEWLAQHWPVHVQTTSDGETIVWGYFPLDGNTGGLWGVFHCFARNPADCGYYLLHDTEAFLACIADH